MIRKYVSCVSLRSAVGVFALATLAPLAAQEELPKRTDIPEDLGGVVLCPDLATAKRMLARFVANDRGNLDLDWFFKGLTENGCVQDSGPLEIIRVVERRDIASGAEGPFMLFEARDPSGGERLFGIIDEAANNRHPRNDFERWLSLHAPDGTILLGGEGAQGYICPDAGAARRVIAAIPPVLRPGERNAHQVKAFEAAIKAANCRSASGRYRVDAVHDSAFISLGYEAGADWTGLTVTDAQGRQHAMVYDASLL